MRKIEANVTDGRRALCAYYLIFMIGYMSRVAADTSLWFYKYDRFIEEMLYTWCAIFWDGVPILCLLIFHYKNFKPHQHELIIRIKDQNNNQELDEGGMDEQ